MTIISGRAVAAGVPMELYLKAAAVSTMEGDEGFYWALVGPEADAAEDEYRPAMIDAQIAG